MTSFFAFKLATSFYEFIDNDADAIQFLIHVYASCNVIIGGITTTHLYNTASIQTYWSFADNDLMSVVNL